MHVFYFTKTFLGQCETFFAFHGISIKLSQDFQRAVLCACALMESAKLVNVRRSSVEHRLLTSFKSKSESAAFIISRFNVCRNHLSVQYSYNVIDNARILKLDKHLNY